MARKKDRVALGDSDSLSNNPFASLLKGVSSDVESGDAEPSAPAPVPGREWSLATTPRVVLRMERKGHGGKTVTVLTGFEAPPEALKALCKRLKKKLGCGARVVEGDVVLQGDLRDRARAWLLSEGVRRVG